MATEINKIEHKQNKNHYMWSRQSKMVLWKDQYNRQISGNPYQENQRASITK